MPTTKAFLKIINSELDALLQQKFILCTLLLSPFWRWRFHSLGTRSVTSPICISWWSFATSHRATSTVLGSAKFADHTLNFRANFSRGNELAFWKASPETGGATRATIGLRKIRALRELDADSGRGGPTRSHILKFQKFTEHLSAQVFCCFLSLAFSCFSWSDLSGAASRSYLPGSFWVLVSSTSQTICCQYPQIECTFFSYFKFNSTYSERR